MNKFLGFVCKEFYHIIRDWRSLIILLGMPIAEMFIFGYVLTNEIKKVDIAVYNPSNDKNAQKFIDKMEASGYFTVKEYITSPYNVDSIFKKGKIKEVVLFEPSFSYNLEKNNKASIQIISDASDANFSNLVVNYTMGIIRKYQQENMNISNASFQIIPEIRMLYNTELKGAYYFVPGIITLILMLISALMTSVSIVREKEYGTMEILLVSPLKPIEIILGKVSPYVGLAFTNALLILLVGYFVFGIPIRGSIILLLFEFILYVLLALSLGILISTATNSQQVAILISMVALMLPTVILSGFIFPIENMPKILQWLCAIMPPKYFNIILKSIMLKGVGLAYVWKETLILLVMTVFFIIASIRKFKIRID